MTELSPVCLRVELVPQGEPFLDAPTLMVPERPHGIVLDEVDTGRWRSSSGAVEVAVLDGDVEVRWRHGGMAGVFRASDPDPGNLGGTVRSLDVVGGHSLPELPPSLLSRRGAVVVEDPGAHPGARDLYVFAYGHDHRAALRDWIALTGRPALIPRHCLGLWWSRYHPHTHDELLAIADRFAAEGMPLDVLVVDCDWHLHGWEGYDFNPACFPDPERFFAALRERDVHTTFNVHPSGALQVADTHYEDCLRRLAAGRVAEGEGVVLDLGCVEEAAIGAGLRRPLEGMGVDFWWVDGFSSRLDGADPQMVTNQAFHDAALQRQDRRPVVFSRYGGHGSQRHGIGFTADTQSHWAVLDYLVDFTAAAANEAFGTWSHDVGGFLGVRLDDELLRRWLQAAALWPILRLHSTQHGERLPWEYDESVLDAARTVAALRRRVVPMLYSLAHELHRTGLAPYRPMHLAFPDWEEATEVRGQAMLGDALLTAPVVEPAREPGGVALRRVQLPPGTWHELDASLDGGRRLHGPATLVVRAGPQDMPLYGRAGGIVVEQDPSRRGAGGPPDPLVVTVFHGAGGSFLQYDDDGVTRAHEQGAVAVTPIAYDDATATVRLGPVQGDPSVLPAQRRVVVRLVGVDAADAVAAPTGIEVTRLKGDGRRQVAAEFVWNVADGAVWVRFDGARVDPAREAQLDVAARLRDALRAAGESGDAAEAMMAWTRAALHVVVECNGERLTPRVEVAQPDVDGCSAEADVADPLPLRPGQDHALVRHTWPLSLRLQRLGATVAEVRRTVTQDLTYARLFAVRNRDGEWRHLAATLSPHPLDEPQARVDLAPFAGSPIEIAATLRSDRPQEVLLRCTGDKPGQHMAVNGEPVPLHREPFRNHHDRLAAVVRLRQGDNQVRIGFDAPGYDHFLSLQATTPDGEPPPGVRVVQPAP